ncbi:MAG: hypothetical protein Q8Q69_06310 [Nitrosopumilaceae archaeon]|nr:hypothetical protein [Nitrosopumilaceae archaeon]
MKKLYHIALLSSLALLSTLHISAESQNQEELICVPEPSTKRVGANPYTYSPQLFTADNDITGRYWAGNKKYPAKAFIGEEEYTHIIVIKKSQINQKSKKRLRKHKDYLGFYINAATNIAYNLYGDKKYPDKINDAPDADVLTMIAIKEDSGIGE